MNAVLDLWTWLKDLKWYQEWAGSVMYLILEMGDGDIAGKYLKFQSLDASAMTTIWQYFDVLGMIMLLIFFCIDLTKIQLEQRGDMTIQSAFGPFFKMLAGLALISQGEELLSGLLGMNNSIVTWIDGVNIFGGGSGQNPTDIAGGVLQDTLKELKLIPAIIIILFGLILFLLSRLCYLVIIYQAISRKIEMILRGGLMPVAIGDVYKGLDSNGVRYVKKFIALCLWGMAMIAVIKIGNGIWVSRIVEDFADLSDIWKILGALLGSIVYPLAEAGMVSASKQVCTDVMGC